MSTTNIIRAWKDPEYRESLSEAELAALPQNPAGLIDLTDTELEGVAGGAKPTGKWFSTGCPCSRQQGGTCRVGSRGCCNAQLKAVGIN